MQCKSHLSFYFNPRSDERSDSSSSLLISLSPISIHAPTNGATVATNIPLVKCAISIHAPTNGATCKGALPIWI